MILEKKIKNRKFARVIQQECAGCCAETNIELCRELRDETCQQYPESDMHIWEEVTNSPPNPGHPSATNIGCTCSFYHNDGGMGAHGTFDASQRLKVFYVHNDCALHGNGTLWLQHYMARRS